jgi:hypothetical protein
MVNTYFTGRSMAGGNSAGRQSGSGGAARVVERSAPKVEPRAMAVDVGALSRYGTAHGTHVMDRGGRELPVPSGQMMHGPGFEAKGPRPTVAGPGGGRTVEYCGSQHGLVRDPVPQQSSHRGWEVPPHMRRGNSDGGGHGY